MISRFSILSDSREVVEGSGSSVHLVPHLALVAAAAGGRCHCRSA